MSARKPADFDGMPIVDVDTHYTEPYDLWVSRAPSNIRSRVPQVHVHEGVDFWFINEKPMGRAGAASVIGHQGKKLYGTEFFSLTIRDVDPACNEVGPRLAAMDEMGVDAQIVYGNLLGFGGQRAFGVDPELRLVSTQIYNDAMADLQSASGGRMYPMALLPWWDMDQCLIELERCHKLGLRGVNTNSDPQGHGLPDLATDHWDPLWEMCAGLDMPVNFHIGASDDSMTWFGTSPWPSFSNDRKLALGSAMMYLSNAKVIGNIIYSGILEKFPNLKFVSVESGVGWIPFVLQALDYQLTETAPAAMDFLTMKPSDYFRRQIYSCFWFERDDLVPMIEKVGADNVMFETDFPHPTCLYPEPLVTAAQALEGASEALKRKVMGGNAVKLYNLPL
jgi:predicted TIM-barrel fold metal-dependent hydrolase